MQEVASHDGDRLSILTKEYERVCTEIRTLESQNDKIVGFGLTIIGAGAAYGLNQHLIEVFVVLPSIFIGVFLYAVLQYHNIFWYGGYKRALEEKINEILGAPTLVWEAVVEHKRQRVHIGNFPLVAIYLMLLTANCVYSVVEVFKYYGAIAGFYESILLITFLVALLFAVRRTFEASHQAYIHAAALLEETPESDV